MPVEDEKNLARGGNREMREDRRTASQTEGFSATAGEHPGWRAVAERIAEELFVNGSGQEAHRLVLTSRDGRDLGGWGKSAIIDRIAGVLEGVPCP